MGVEPIGCEWILYSPACSMITHLLPKIPDREKEQKIWPSQNFSLRHVWLVLENELVACSDHNLTGKRF